MNAPVPLHAEHIVKRFGAVTALDGVTVELRQGEILGILGDNGAGKSTLIKIFTGYERQTSGRLLIAGRETALRSVDHARTLGIECVYQDLALANSLSVYLNLFLNREITWAGPIRLVNHRAMRRQISGRRSANAAARPSDHDHLAIDSLAHGFASDLKHGVSARRIALCAMT